MKVKSFADLMAGHAKAEILCAVKKTVVRRLKVVDGQSVRIDSMSGPMIVIPLSTEIRYEPWFMDRGSLLFSCEEMPEAKICTEFDLVRFPDGTEWPIHPDVDHLTPNSSASTS